MAATCNIEGRGGALAQLGCLFVDVISTLVTSAVHSLRLLLPGASSRSGNFKLYQGRVWHERRRPILHRFEYNVSYALVDLERMPDWFQARAALHHLGLDQAREIAGTKGPVHLLTIPASVGYEQNPLSVYYCYDIDGSLAKCIAEVTNTPWAERVTFAFDPQSDMVPKPLHVSPFMDMQGTWRIQASNPGEELQIAITVQHAELGNNYFSAVLKAKRVEHTKAAEVLFWLMPHKVAVWIYWHAVVLLIKGVPFIAHPKYVDGILYREVAKGRDKKLNGNIERYCRWREAHCWPWK
ncbi:hypothetical protein SELMODRAFT_178500 [Selaginella moellendorffii]|uniref:DUF1365 domain-containing protein n=1 Tax=Selaginella moellendorffii TaxID=88036 RepID=D8SBX8_SELML|nr:uncharacterized protein LOC9656988 [Selaginella moellendorffii]EFJ18086.1 hypothetical protein SELMODRAFT_178500 [Selaginella moellendorffii]|eukprot:XP_002980901.1 uncharacterized protein LOC9656988 [Selaginella moellendorffii]